MQQLVNQQKEAITEHAKVTEINSRKLQGVKI